MINGSNRLDLACSMNCPIKRGSFHQLIGLSCALASEYEDDDDNVVSLKMLFEGVEASKCTCYRACTVGMIETAYD